MKFNLFRSFAAAVVAGMLFFSGAVAAASTFPHCLSGSWYEPATTGSGVIIDSTPAATLAYLFTFDNDKPTWLVGAKRADADNVFDLIAVNGQSITLPRVSTETIGSLSLVPVSNNLIDMTWTIDWPTNFCSGFSPPDPLCGGHKRLVRLTQPTPCAE